MACVFWTPPKLSNYQKYFMFYCLIVYDCKCTSNIFIILRICIMQIHMKGWQVYVYTSYCIHFIVFFSSYLYVPLIWCTLHSWALSEHHKEGKACHCSWPQHGRTVHHWCLLDCLEETLDLYQHTHRETADEICAQTWGSHSTPLSRRLGSWS